MRPGERFEDVFRRLRGEFGADITSFTQVDLLNVSEEERGHFVTPVFLVDLDGDGRMDDAHGWFSLKELPSPMVNHHVHRVFPTAVRAFEEREEMSL